MTAHDPNLMTGANAFRARLGHPGLAKLVQSLIATFLMAGMLAACAQAPGQSPKTEAPSPEQGRAYADAIVHYQTLLNDKPAEIEAVLGLARNLRWAGRTQEAADVLKRHRQHADNGRYQAELGKVRLLQGDFDQGANRLETAAKQVGDDWRLYSALGIALDYQERFDQAEDAYLKALDMCPDDAAVLNNLGVSRALSGRLDRAVLTLEEALAMENDRAMGTHRSAIERNLKLFTNVRDLCPTCGADYLKSGGSTILAAGLRGTDREGPCTPEPQFTQPTEMERELVQAPSINIKVYFEFDSAILKPEAKETLDNLGTALTSGELSPYRFEIAGHTDAVGSEAYNQNLSERRAEAVLTYLVDAFGIDPARIDTQGYGESRLLMPEDPEGDANRRVQVTRLERMEE